MHPETALDEVDWRARIDRHRERVEPWVRGRLDRRRRQRSHPVDDFLFDYYAWRPGQLLRWHPGWGVSLHGDVREWADVRGYRVDGGVAGVDPEHVARLRPVVSSIAHLLRSTASRPPALGCFGRHEWAMVYRSDPLEIRHSTWPLRASTEVIADVVESAPLRCTHIDAFRFFTDEARPLNATTPTRASQSDDEQPGCLHATMDLYRWCFRLYPVVGADLTADAFALAREARDVDMRAAPYDLSDLGYAPIRIETPAGRQEYATHQRRIADRGARLRTRIIGLLDSIEATTREPAR